MTRLILAVALTVALSPVSFAQDFAGMDLPPGDKAVADPQLHSLNISQMAAEEIANNPAGKGPKVTKVTGTIEIKTGKGVMTVKAGQPVPPIPEGAEIVVISGQVVVEKGGVSVTAGAGDSFTMTEGKSGVQVSATGKTAGLVVAAGGTKATLTAGSAVAVKGGSVTVTAGTASVSVNGGPAQTVAAGKSASDSSKNVASNEKKESQDSDAPESLVADSGNNNANNQPSSNAVQERQTAPVSPSAP